MSLYFLCPKLPQSCKPANYFELEPGPNPKNHLNPKLGRAFRVVFAGFGYKIDKILGLIRSWFKYLPCVLYF